MLYTCTADSYGMHIRQSLCVYHGPEKHRSQIRFRNAWNQIARYKTKGDYCLKSPDISDQGNNPYSVGFADVQSLGMTFTGLETGQFSNF